MVLLQQEDGRSRRLVRLPPTGVGYSRAWASDDSVDFDRPALYGSLAIRRGLDLLS